MISWIVSNEGLGTQASANHGRPDNKTTNASYILLLRSFLFLGSTRFTVIGAKGKQDNKRIKPAIEGTSAAALWEAVRREQADTTTAPATPTHKSLAPSKKKKKKKTFKGYLVTMLEELLTSNYDRRASCDWLGQAVPATHHQLRYCSRRPQVCEP